jgi:hypothetical protein
MSDIVFTFEDRVDGTTRSIIAQNEAAVRLRLGGIWVEVGRTAARMPRDVADLPEMLHGAQVAEEEASCEMLAANPMGKGQSTPEAMATFIAAQERHP